MNKKSKFLIYSFFILSALFVIEVGYLYASKSMSREGLDAKMRFVGAIKLPDLSIATESSYVRHRSLSDFFSIYKDDGSLREYFASTYVFSGSDIINKKNNNEK
ncbi:MAG: hypothetical protein Q8N78_05085 [Sulfurimonas sp.]|nr:hypothetical protein [Sulfurimonas sp.]